MESEDRKPVIFEYTHYRNFLKDLCSALKRSEPQFSLRYFARKAGFSSHNFLKLVMDGKRNLSPASINMFARALKLSREESIFFKNLVLLNQSVAADEKEYYAGKLVSSRAFKKLYPVKPSQYTYYSQWYLVAIRELTSCVDFQEDPAWIAKKLVPSISAAEAQKAIEMLLELGLLKRDENGKLVQSQELIATADEVSSAFITQFHKKMIEKGSEAIELFKAADRDVSSITIALSEESFRQIKEMIQRFRQELLEIAGGEEKPDRIYQVNFQSFPLSRLQESGIEK